MKYTILGRSLLRVSVLGLGGNVFGYFASPSETARIIDAARDMGVNFIDTATVYSNGLSEEYIGQAIKKHRQSWVIASKVGINRTEKPHGKGAKQTIIASVEGSLKRLRTDYLDLYQMHHFDPDTPLEESIAAFHELIKQGTLRAFGVTNYSATQLGNTWNTSRKLPDFVFASAQNHYNLLKRDIEKTIMPFCKEKQLGLIIYGALARGVLSGKYQQGKSLPESSRAAKSLGVRQDLTDTVFETLTKLSAFAQGYGKTPSELALSWILSHPEVATVLVGIRDTAQLKINTQAVSWKLTSQDLRTLDRLIGKLSKFSSSSLGSFIKV